MTKPENKRLTEKEQAFVDSYLIEPSAPDAAQAAGYSNPRKVGCVILKKPHVREAIKEAQRERSIDTGIDPRWVLEEQKRVYETAMAGKPLVDSHGRPVRDESGNVIMRRDLTNANKALDQISKHVDVDAVASQRTNNVNINSDADLAARLMAHRRRMAKRTSTDNVINLNDEETA